MEAPCRRPWWKAPCRRPWWWSLDGGRRLVSGRGGWYAVGSRPPCVPVGGPVCRRPCVQAAPLASPAGWPLCAGGWPLCAGGPLFAGGLCTFKAARVHDSPVADDCEWLHGCECLHRWTVQVLLVQAGAQQLMIVRGHNGAGGGGEPISSGAQPGLPGPACPRARPRRRARGPFLVSTQYYLQPLY